MVQDSSVDFQDTWDFLGRRMEDSAALGQARKQVSTQWAQFHGQEVLLHWVYTRHPDLIVMYWTVNSLQYLLSNTQAGSVLWPRSALCNSLQSQQETVCCIPHSYTCSWRLLLELSQSPCQLASPLCVSNSHCVFGYSNLVLLLHTHRQGTWLD